MKEYFKKLKYLFSWKDVFFTVLLFGIILTMAMCKADGLVQVTFGESSVDVVSSRYSMNIPYEMVESIELVDVDEDSEIINGRGDMAIRTGVWSNERWGEHYVCLDLDSKQCIAVYLNDGRVFLFNRDDDKTTAADFEIFGSYLEENTN